MAGPVGVVNERVAGLERVAARTCKPSRRTGYTFQMKTAISLPDRIFREAELTAKRLKVSRSAFYRRALEALIGSQRGGDVKALTLDKS